MKERGVEFALPSASRIVETGGFKGRTRTVERDDLYARITDAFGIPRGEIVSEYGMTELSSQYYSSAGGAYVSPPWLRTRVVGPDRATLASGKLGSLLHVDLANRASCIAIQTEDLGMHTGEGLVLTGREGAATLRGCSLDAEQLSDRAV
jgi:hypothetical protein